LSITDELIKIKERKSFDAFTNLCDGFKAANFQAVSVLLWLYAKKGLFMFDPGMGKTFAIAMGLKALFSTNKNTKCLFLIKKTQLTQTSNDIRLYTKKRVVTCTAQQEQLSKKLSKNIDNYDVLMLTHETLQSNAVCAMITQNINRFNVLVVDEAHYLTNMTDSDRIIFLAALAKKIEYVAFSTATPYISKPEQLSSLLNLMDCDIFERRDLITRDLKRSVRIDTLYPLQIYNYDRKSEGIANSYKSYTHWVEPHEHQKRAEGAHYLKQLRGQGAENQVKELVRGLKTKKEEGKKGIVFIYYKETLEWVMPFLDVANINYSCINGDTSQRSRDKIQSDFQHGLLDCVLISVATSINLDCEYVYFYEYTLEFKQILGRGERGLNPKLMELHFIFTKQTQDAQYFLDTVYKLSEDVRSWIGKEYSEFLQIKDDIVI